jgi:putative phosphoesterase
MRLAVLADIHGNILALEAVLSDLAMRKPDLVVDLGDCASGPLWPRETMDRLSELKLPTVRGNHDRQVATLSPDEMGLSDRFAFDQLEEKYRARLKALPFRLNVAPGVLAFHAAPAADDVYLVEEVDGARLVPSHPDAIAKRLGAVDAKLVLCGHSHQARVVQLPGGPIILNPGSVGCPAYEDTPLSRSPARIMRATRSPRKSLRAASLSSLSSSPIPTRRQRIAPRRMAGRIGRMVFVPASCRR